MSAISWVVLIILAFIFISAGLALVMYFSFWASDGKFSAIGAVIFLIVSFVMAIIMPNYTASPIIPATIIAGFFLVAILGVVAHFLLPNFDNKDVIKAARPILLFSILSGILVAVANIAKAFIA
ncbi:MAG: hypothetical protein WCT26_02990 [Candidatus Buchananbacteria bacterium]|jgi:hypothetical protein